MRMTKSRKSHPFQLTTVSWSNVDTPYLIPTPFFKNRNNKKDGLTDRQKHFLSDR